MFWLVALVCVDGAERSPSTNALADVYGVGGVDTSGETMAVVAGAE